MPDSPASRRQHNLDIIYETEHLVLRTAIAPPVWRGALCCCEARTLRLELAAYVLRTVLSA